MIYKMDEQTEKFTLYQSLQTRGAFGLEYFSIADKHFLAVANFYDGTYQLDWNGMESSLSSFSEYLQREQVTSHFLR